MKPPVTHCRNTLSLVFWSLLWMLLISTSTGWAQGVEWAKGPDNYLFAGSSTGNQVAVDAAGNTYVTGTGGASVAFEGLLPAAQRGTGNLFILKRDPNGQPLWVLRASGAIPLALALDGAGQPVVAGTITGSATFGSITLNSAGGTDGFVARLSAAGAWLGAVRAGGPGADQFAGLAVQPDGTAYVTGRFLQTATFAGLPPLATTTGRPTMDTDMLVARLSPANAWDWAVAAGTNGADAGQGIVADAAGRVSVTGIFRDSIDFGSLPRLRARKDARQNGGTADLFVAQLEAATGAWQWATRAGGNGPDAGLALAADASGALYVGGYFQRIIDFGDSLALPVLTARGVNDLLLARLSPAGVWQWATQAGGTGGSLTVPTALDDQALTIAVDAAGTRVTTGGILASGVQSFGPDPAAFTLPNTRVQAFVAQAAGATGVWLNAVTLGTLFGTQTSGVALGAGGAVYATGQFAGTVSFNATRRSSAYRELPPYNGGFANSQNKVFAARLNPDAGTWSQVLLADNGGNVDVRATTHDATGNTYITGHFDGDVVLPTPVPTHFISTGRLDAFVGKLDPQGNWLWAVASEGNGTLDESGAGIAVDAAGRLTVTGYFQNSRINFGSVAATGSTGATSGLNILSTMTGNNSFVAQFEASTGAVRWMNVLVATEDVQALALTRDAATDDLTLVGTFKGTLTLNNGSSATATGQYDGFVARLDAAGQWRWLRHAGGSGIGNNIAYNNLLFTSVQQDGTGAYTIAGHVQGTAQLGSLALSGSDMVNLYFPFFARLNPNGTAWQWLHVDRAYTSYNIGLSPAAAVDAAGNVYVTLPLYQIPAYPLLRQFSPTGVLLRSLTVANATAPYGSVAVDAAGGAVIAGDYSGPATFGGTTLTGSGRFVARLAPGTGTWSWAGAVSGAPLGNLAVVDAGGTMTVGGTYATPPTPPVLNMPHAVVARLLPPPIISSFTPGSGYAGTVVTLSGTGFTDAATVAFNGTAAPGFVVSGGGITITVTVPPGATTGPITVTSAGGTGTSATPFIILLNDLVVSTPEPVSGSYRNVLVTGPATGGAGTATLVGTLTVAGTLTVQDGGSLLTNCQPLTGPGSFVLEAGGTLGICSPQGITQSGPTGSVQLSGTRTFSDDAYYLYNGTAAQVTGNALPGLVRDLTLNNSAGLSLTQNVALRQVLRLTSGHLTRAGQTLTLRSGPAGTALVANTGGQVLAGPGLSQMQRYLSPADNPGAGYRHYASPLVATPLSQWATAGFAPVLTSSYNTSAAPGGTTPFPNMFGYDESRLGGSLATGFSDFDKGWYVPATGPAIGQGLAVNIAPPALVTFSGDFNGAPTAAVSLGRGPQNEAGWHLLGNPFPAPFDLSLPGALATTNVDAAVYVFASSGQYSGAYRAYVNGIGSGPQVLPAGQGFFVRTTTPGQPSQFQFNTAGRVTTFAAQPAFRRGTVDARPQVQLTLQTGPTTADAVYVYANAGATPGTDAAFDAHKLLNPGNPSVYAVAATGEALAIQGLPALAVGTVVPLGVEMPAAGPAVFSAALTHLPVGLTLFLSDAVTGARQDLSIRPTYAFAVPAGSLTERFALVVGTVGGALAATPASRSTLALYPNPARNAVTLVLPAISQARRVQVFNVLGRAVGQALLPAQATMLQLDISSLGAGLYIIRCGGVAKRLVVD